MVAGLVPAGCVLCPLRLPQLCAFNNAADHRGRSDEQVTGGLKEGGGHTERFSANRTDVSATIRVMLIKGLSGISNTCGGYIQPEWKRRTKSSCIMLLDISCVLSGETVPELSLLTLQNLYCDCRLSVSLTWGFSLDLDTESQRSQSTGLEMWPSRSGSQKHPWGLSCRGQRWHELCPSLCVACCGLEIWLLMHPDWTRETEITDKISGACNE